MAVALLLVSETAMGFQERIWGFPKSSSSKSSSSFFVFIVVGVVIVVEEIVVVLDDHLERRRRATASVVRTVESRKSKDSLGVYFGGHCGRVFLRRQSNFLYGE